jgi:isocitrate dehydrogenase (NAD+)
MLRHLGLDYHANQISNAVYNVIKGGRVKTKDMGGHNSTTGVLPTFVLRLLN